MATITVRNLDEGLKRRLRIRAAEHGKSMEEEVRDILRSALEQEPVAGGDSKGASVATRDATDFEGCGIEVINPRVEG